MENYKNKLGVYHLMIVSKYFETINDFINLELSTPKARGNMEKFHFNPISLDDWSRQFFTSLETLHVYQKGENMFLKEHFYKRVIHYYVTYSYWKKYGKRRHWEEYKHVKLNENSSNGMNMIPEGVTDIGDDCFCVSDYLHELSIPNSVTFIGNRFLCGCDNLTAITIPTHWERIGNNVFNNKPHLCSFTIPSNVKIINGKEVEISGMKEYNIPTYVTKLHDYCFKDCEFTKIIIPTTIKELPGRCFDECLQLKELTIPTTITKLGDCCFYNCRSLTTLIIPTSVVELGDCFTLQMKSLKELEIPTSVTKFGSGLFYNCFSLTSVTLHDNYREVGFEEFFQCESLLNITLPSSVTRIDDWSFQFCVSLTSMTMPSTLTNIGEACISSECKITKI